MKRLFSYMRRHWLTYAGGLLATFLTASFYNFIPFFTRDAIDAAQAGHRASLAHYAELIAVVAIVMGTARWISRFVIFNIGRDIEYEIRNDLFAHMAKLGPNFYQRLRTGDLMSRMVNDITALRLMVGMGVLMFTNTPVYFVYALIFMTILNRQLTVAAIIPAIVLLFGVRRTHARADGTQPQGAAGTWQHRSEGAGEPRRHSRRESLHLGGARGAALSGIE